MSIFDPLNGWYNMMNQAQKNVDAIQEAERRAEAQRLQAALDKRLILAVQYAYANFPHYFVKGASSPTPAQMDQGSIQQLSIEHSPAHNTTMDIGGASHTGVLYPARVGIQFSKGHAATYAVDMFESANEGYRGVMIDENGWMIPVQ